MWSNSMSPRLKYTSINLSAHVSRQLDLVRKLLIPRLMHPANVFTQPFVFIHLIFHAVHIVIRRSYLTNLVWTFHPGNAHMQAEEARQSGAPPGFWQTCAHDLFDHAYKLIDIASQYDRCGGLDNTFSPLMGFGVFQAAAVLTYLHRWYWRGFCPGTLSCILHANVLTSASYSLSTLIP